MAFIVNEVNPPDFLINFQKDEEAIWIDVRTSAERHRFPWMEDAIHLDFLDSRFESLIRNLDPYRPYYLYCDTGKRSAMAAATMAEKGFALLNYLKGGKTAFDRWQLISHYQQPI
jgi:rhodanese-related sulfurtransferase